MEFLLQMFADLLGTPSNNQVNAKSENEIVKTTEIQKEVGAEEENLQEAPVIFGSMQFH